MPLSDKSIEIYYIYFVCATMRAKQALIVIVYLLNTLNSSPNYFHLECLNC